MKEIYFVHSLMKGSASAFIENVCDFTSFINVYIVALSRKQCFDGMLDVTM